MTLLGIETSCDETAAAICRQGQILSSIVSSQVIHAKYGGVVPELASREHEKLLNQIVHKALKESCVQKQDIDAIAVTSGPGLAGTLLTGVSFAKGMGLGLNIPVIPINHLEAHIFANFLADPTLKYPFVCLLVSGGHTQIVNVKATGIFKILGESVDDAVGEAFDKTAKVLGLPYPGGPALSALAEKGVGDRFQFPRPMTNQPNLDFSFSGLKTFALNTIKSEYIDEQTRADVARAFVDAVVDTFIIKCRRAIKETGIRQLVVAGGVSANKQLQYGLITMLKEEGCEVFFPRDEYCTDNGAMIAYAGYLRIKKGQYEPLGFQAKPRWPIDNI